MKNSIIKTLAVLFLILAIWALGSTFNHLSAQTLPKVADKVLKDTVINKVTYKLYQGKRGGKYIERTSREGNVYRQYFKSK